MMTATVEPPEVYRVGPYEIRVVVGEPTAESEERWSRRSETIARWLLSQWQREQARSMKEAS